jgi:hypothetical protein
MLNYFVLTTSIAHGINIPSDNQLNEIINEYAAKGWMLHSLSELNDDRRSKSTYRLIFFK